MAVKLKVGEQEVLASTAGISAERLPDGSVRLTIGDRVVVAWVEGDDVWIEGRVRRVSAIAAAVRAAPPAQVTPPMPGAVTRVFVKPGEAVKQGQKLLAISAMKLETVLKSPRDAVVRAVNVEPGAQVKPGQILVELEP